MIWIRIARWLAIAVFAVIAIVVAGSLLSLDWDREHSARTDGLPLLAEADAGGDGLVRIPARGHFFRARVAGLGGTGPELLLLHGFPETSAMWTPLIDAAAARGYRVVAFDQRGYSPGARPEGVADYAVPELVNDVLAVADAVGFERFHLVGHDWGALVGWSVAIEHAQRLRSWTALSIPHPGVIFETLRDDPPGYVQFFQMPWLPELLFTWNRLALLRGPIYSVMPPAQRDEYLAVFAEPGALSAALDWYRAIPAAVDAFGGRDLTVYCPVLFVWGSRDLLYPSMREGQRRHIEGAYAELELPAGHWLMQEQPDAVIEAILDHVEG